MILDLLAYPDPRLKQMCEPVDQVDDAVRLFIHDLEDTMRAGPGSVGIAAPQVGDQRRIIIVDVSAKKKIKHHGRLVLINPEITEWEDHKIGREGCMSVPDYTGNVLRAKKITVTALDEAGIKQEIHAEGYEARALQHEIDHLNGILFLDRIVSRRSDLFQRQKK